MAGGRPGVLRRGAEKLAARPDRIHYGADGYAQLIRLPAYERANVLADPTRSFGQPIFGRGGAPVSDVLDRFWAGDDIRTLTQEFGVPADEIEDVLRAGSSRTRQPCLRTRRGGVPSS